MRPFIRVQSGAWFRLPARILTCVTLLLASSVAGVGAQNSPTAREVEAAFGRITMHPLWPGFNPATVALAMYDGRDTWLFRHPRPPAGFSRNDGAWVYAGRHESMTANQGILLDSVWTATLLMNPAIPAEKNAGVLVHEAFHTYQRQRHPDWTANEVALFEYPVEDSVALAYRRLETESLRRALSSARPDEVACWTAAALGHRTTRFALMPPTAAEYERASELNEGIPDYVEQRATGDTLADPFPPEEYAPDEFRLRSYTSGYALARLLDRFRPGWPRILESKTYALDALLSEAIRPEESRACGLNATDRERAVQRARDDIQRMRVARNQKLADFNGATGWTLVVIAASGSPLFPQQFDPLNVQNLGSGRVLHTRQVRMGNEAGFVETFGRTTLTESTGRHPLFEGVRAVRITGITREPTPTRNGGIRLNADGIRVEFRSGTVERQGRTITLRLS